MMSNDEMLSDAFPQKPVIDEEGNEVPGCFQVRTRFMALRFDLGCQLISPPSLFNALVGGYQDGPI